MRMLGHARAAAGLGRPGLSSALVLGLLVLAVGALPPGAHAAGNAPDFAWGVVFHPDQSGKSLQAMTSEIRDLGVGVAKYWMDWSGTEPVAIRLNAATEEVSTADRPGFTLPLRSQIEARAGLVHEYAFPEDPASRFHGIVDWAREDRILGALAALHLSPVPLIADATTAPRLPSGKRMGPDAAGSQTAGYEGVGPEAYLGHAYLYVRAAALRYGGAPGSPVAVSLWNTENELNWAYVHVAVAGWRQGTSWYDQSFCGKLLATLHDAVHAGNPSARSTMNFNVHDPGWEAKFLSWRDAVDVVGLGLYPNYLYAAPVHGEYVYEAVQEAHLLGGGKPVWVLETGYPSGPASGGWNEELQAQYAGEAATAAYRAGAAGYVHFALDDYPIAVPDGEFTAVEPHWGLFRVDGTPKPAFDVLRQIVSDPHSAPGIETLLVPSAGEPPAMASSALYICRRWQRMAGQAWMPCPSS